MVNGEEQVVGDGATVDDVAATVIERPRGVAVAVNGEVVPRSVWGTTSLCEDDRVEVITASQGG